MSRPIIGAGYQVQYRGYQVDWLAESTKHASFS